ncbi:YjgB family protein [Paenibacillus caui]|uniref:YjgB family protein n=1 Tax=Paenibacillus caui TaxID=2873927 RepID=UPI001CA7EB1E|nr:YjgB family protein [Paenibacillus caui]
MNFKKPAKKAAITFTMAGIVGLSALGLGINNTVLPVQQANAASTSSYVSEQALKTLNSFYKPALQGQFPGTVSGLTVGESTKQDVIKKLGDPSIAGKDADAFDLYGADMGNPGYAFSYKLNKIREMRYFGTNVERQTNIGGITMKMLKQHWFAPDASATIKNGKSKQIKLTYVRGAYKLEFIFNSSTDLDHINLLKG